MVRPMLVLLASLLAVGLAPAVHADAAAAEFARASEAYRASRWDEAAEGFRKVLGQGIADARVEYNLAGAEYKRGRLGESVLHYERAHRLDPADADTAANLALVRGKIRDVVPSEDTGPGVLAGVTRMQDRLGVAAQGVLTLAGSWLVAALIVLCASRPGGFTPARSWILAGAIGTMLLAGLSWRSTERRLYRDPRAVVMLPSVEALAGPGLENTVLFTLHEGTTVRVRSDRDGWLQVTIPSGLTGWVVRDAAERI